MAAHILQLAYYLNLQETRALMLKSAGYRGFLRSACGSQCHGSLVQSALPQNSGRGLAAQQMGRVS
jgi:hypothetical protein